MLGGFSPPGEGNPSGRSGSLIRVFSATFQAVGGHIVFSRATDLMSIFQSTVLFPCVGVWGAYKRKADKVLPVKEGISDGSVPGGIRDWKQRRIEEAVERRPLEPPHEYDKWITPKFSEISRGERLTVERLEQLTIGEELWPKEKAMFMEMMFRREKAFAFEFSEIGRISDDVCPPQEIRTVLHEAWQAPGFPVPKHLVGKVIEMLRERIRAGTLEYCHRPYRNQWFLVKKKSGKYRIVDAAMRYNAVTIRDANMPPNIDEISEEFAGCQITSVIDFFSGYDQVTLHPNSRDITGFMTPLGLLRHTTLVQGATNSVAQFVRVGTKILEDHIPGRARIFIDDVPVFGPRTRYNEGLVSPGIRRFVQEHLTDLDLVLCDIERAGAIIGPKSQFGISGIKFVRFVCTVEGRSPDSEKVIKILDWPACSDATQARAFLGVCVYYRIWIKGFALIAEPIYRLLKKDTVFDWTGEQDAAMDRLKLALTSALALVRLDVSEEACLIILAVDASLQGWGIVLM